MIEVIVKVLRRQISITFAGIVVSLAVAIVIMVGYFKGLHTAPDRAALEMAQSTRDMAASGSFASKRFQALHDNLRELSRLEHSVYWQDVYSETVSGCLLPMHGQLLGIITAPAFLIIGEWAFVLVPALLAITAVMTVFLIVERLTQNSIVWGDLLLALFGTPIVFNSADFGYDLLGAALVVVALYQLINRPVLGGLILGSTLFIRPTNVIFFPMIFVATPARRSRGQSILLATLGLFVVGGGYLLLNFCLWGGFFTTIHDRMPYYVNGDVIFQGPSFSWRIFWEDWFRKLFASDVGFIRYAPIVLLLPWALFRLWARRHRLLAVLITLMSLIMVGVTFSFECWMCTTNGNRFLLPVSALILVVVLLATRRDLNFKS